MIAFGIGPSIREQDLNEIAGEKFLNLPDGQGKYFEEFNLQKNCEINSTHQKIWEASWIDVWAGKC